MIRHSRHGVNTWPAMNPGQTTTEVGPAAALEGSVAIGLRLARYALCTPGASESPGYRTIWQRRCDMPLGGAVMTTRSQAALRGTIGGVGLGVCLGAALMYLFDADSGRRRRALARDRAVRALHRGSRTVKATARDLTHRARGAAAGTRWRLRRAAEEVPDDGP